MEKLDTSQLENTIFLRDIAETWKDVLNTDKKVYILSPYITSIIETLLKNPNNCEIYTTFEFRNFLSGSSDIQTLKKLISKDVKIYSIPKLHAKIVLVSETFVSIGSQNLTNNGTKNKEATVTSREKEVVEFVESKIKEWIIERKAVSLEMLDDVENRINLIQENYDKLQAEIKESNKFVDEQEKKREIERKKRKDRFKQTISEVKDKSRSIIGTIKKKKFLREFKSGYVEDGERWTLILNDNKIFLDSLIISSRCRYLAVNSNNNKLGWARVNKKSITYFSSGVSFKNKLNIKDKKYNWKLIANWDDETLCDFNLKAIIELEEISTNLEIRLFFDCKTLSICSIRPKVDSFESTFKKQAFQETINWIKQNKTDFKKKILDQILDTFNYKNRKLQGIQSNSFFNEIENQKFEMTVGKLQNGKFLIFKEQK